MRFALLTLVSLLGLSLASPLAIPLEDRTLLKRQTPLNAFLTVLLDYLPAVDGTLESVISIVTTFQALVALLTGQATTYNELSGACKTYTVIFARGTNDPGNVGVLVGPPFFEALRTAVGSSALAIQGVNGYDADIDGYLAGGDAGGITSM